MSVLGPNKTITRIYSDEKNVATTAFPSSGFSQSHQVRFDGILGRLIPYGIHHVCPHDKFVGVNSGAITLEHINTPNAPDLQVHSYNFLGTYRSIDTGFEDLMSPSKLNGFSGTASLPIFTPSEVLAKVLNALSVGFDSPATNASVMLGALRAMKSSSSSEAQTILEEFSIEDEGITEAAGWNEFIAHVSASGRSFLPYSSVKSYMDTVYCSDVLVDFMDWAVATTGTITFETASSDYRVMAEVIFQYYYKWISMFIGAGSNMDFLGYPVTNMRTVDNISSGVFATIMSVDDLPYLLLYGQRKSLCRELPCNEYALRLLACVWICYFRNVQLEPLNADLRWRKWGSSSMLSNANSAQFWMLLTMRALPWAQDMVTSGMIDDVADHVYAPLVQSNTNSVLTGTSVSRINTDSSLVVPASPSGGQYSQLAHSTLQQVDIQYFDHSTNSNVSISTIVPSSIGRFMSLANPSTESSFYTYQFDLRTLKQASNLERFLHRVFYFGDQYSDAQKNFWQVDMSDALTFIPKLLSGGVQLLGQQQEVANSGGTGEAGSNVPQGTRTATMSGSIPSDPYSDFAEEFGAVLNVMYIAPTVQYDPLLRQNLFRAYTDFPNPVFAADNESIMYCCEFSRSQANAMRPWAHVPYANEYRSRLNSVHGKFLHEYADWTVNRFFGSDPNQVPNLNWATLHMSGMRLGCFDSNVLLDGQFYVLAEHKFNVERLLPAPVEYC